MKNSLLASGALLASLVASAPLVERQQYPNIDTTVLQFALTLEHLENVFYKGALTKFSQQQFARAGYGSTYYNNLRHIAYDEEQHVKLLTGAIAATGATPVAACTYNFPYTDVASFITLSSVLEGVGTSAYLGGAPLITSKAYLTVAGSILVTEALHTSYQRAAINEVPFPTPYGTPLDPMSVYTLAAAFIVSCPPSNPPLPFTPFPALTYDAQTGSHHGDGWWGSTHHSGGLPAPGQKLMLTAASNVPAGSYVTFISGLMVVSVKGTVSGSDITAVIPPGIGGQTYVFVTSADVEMTFDDSKVLFGPAIVEVAPNTPTIDFNYLKE